MRRGDGFDTFSFAKHRDPVADGENLVELVCDNDHGAAFAAHSAQDLKQLLRLLRCQNGCRFIQYQDIGAPVKHFQYLDGLLLADRHIVNFLFGVGVEAEFPADFLYFLDQRTFFAVFLVRLFCTQHDILRGGHDVDKLEMLMNHADSQRKRVFWRVDNRFFTAHKNRPAVRMVDAGQNVHQRSLPRAVFPEQREDLSVSDGKADAVVGRDGAESF